MAANGGTSKRHRVIIVGAGFGGLWAVKHLKGAPVDIALIDQRNHHLFQPLLYQVATASLAPSEVAWPIRSMLHDRKDVTTILGMVVCVDPTGRTMGLAISSCFRNKQVNWPLAVQAFRWPLHPKLSLFTRS